MTFRLFTVFHGNLDFSSLPDRDLPSVIARCYWPLLRLADEARMPLGIEMPARTLLRIADEDPEWVKAFRSLADRGLVEAVASGWAQVVAPLVPVDVNRANLQRGRDAYEELLGSAPATWFVNEQTWSEGLAELYAEVGAESIVSEWNNPASRRQELRPLRYRTARVRGDQRDITLLFNDCVFFQKLQRAAHGLCPESDYLAAVERARGAVEAHALCAYGGDLEIFDYRPGHDAPVGAEQGVEFQRLSSCLRALAATPGQRFALPRDVAADTPVGPVVQLASATDPLPCKKQPRYNPTRWAVSGRDGFGMNTRCAALRRELHALSRLDDVDGSRATAALVGRSLVELWGSDYRTRATEEKLAEFHTGMGLASAQSRSALERATPGLPEGGDILLINASDEAWRGEPIEVPLRFPPGRFAAVRALAEPEGALPDGAQQLEVVGRHTDGSVRRAILVLEPRIPARGRVSIRLTSASAGPQLESESAQLCSLKTASVEADFLPHRGGALARLRFPDISDRPLAGTIPHGSFDAIEYTPDFYSGHVVAVTETAGKVADLSRSIRVSLLSRGDVRTSVEFRVSTPLGEWSKRYRIYEHHPRLDLVHELRFNEAHVSSLRLGVLTVHPDAFDRDHLGYAAVNGGRQPDVFEVPHDRMIAQQLPASASVSATSCLGATEGWVSVGDRRSGIAMITDRSQSAAVPLLEHADVEGRPFTRIHHSVAETDETRATFLRGVVRPSFAYFGHRADLDAVRQAAGAVERGLVYRTESGSGIARGL